MYPIFNVRMCLVILKRPWQPTRIFKRYPNKYSYIHILSFHTKASSAIYCFILYLSCRDVQCISCDNPSVMRSTNTMEDLMPAPPLPAQQSVKPYLTYKLDQVRKQQQKWALFQSISFLTIQHLFTELIHSGLFFLTGVCAWWKKWTIQVSRL